MTGNSAVFVVLFGVAACAGTGSGTSSSYGSVSGSVGSYTFTIADAISASVTLPESGGQHGAVIVMSTASNLCTDATNHVEHPNEKTILLTLTDNSGSALAAPTAPGSYAITTDAMATQVGVLETEVFDATCNGAPDGHKHATSGTVTLSEITGGAFSGSFDVVMNSGDHITGTFDPEACPGLDTAINSRSPSSCM
jgi:hypothetical protein